MQKRRIVAGLWIAYVLYAVVFFTLGFFSEHKPVAWVSFLLDASLCAASFWLNVRLMRSDAS